MSEERQAAVSSLQQLLDSQAPGDRALAALLAAVPGLAQGSLARIRASPGLYSTLQVRHWVPSTLLLVPIIFT